MKINIIIFLFLFSQISFADTFNWDNKHINIKSGIISNLKNISNVKYRIGYEYSGFGHLRSGIELNWIDSNGQNQIQTIFDSMVCSAPRISTSETENSIIVFKFDEACIQEPKDITQPDLIYKYKKDQNIFLRIIL